MIKALEEASGLILLVIVLLDIFFLVLDARSNIGIYSKHLSHSLWRFMVWVSRPFGERKGSLLALAGPIIVVTILLTWGALLSIAIALIIHPNLGTGIVINHGKTPTDFLTALYVGGTSLSFIGASDFSPQSGFFRIFYLVTSLLGVSLISLTITYLMELYSDLQERNSIGLMVYLMTRETGDAAEALAAIGPRGNFEAGYENLSNWAYEISTMKESHHFFPVLFYFRFRQSYYSISEMTLISLDAVSLIKSTLDEKEYGWLKKSASVDLLWRGSLMELGMLAKNFIPDARIDVPPDAQKRDDWQRRYHAAVERLNRAGIKTSDKGEEEYIALRTQWDLFITLLAPKFGYEMYEIDSAMAKVKDQEGKS